MFCERMKEYQGGLQPFAPYAAAEERKAWEALPAGWREETLRLGERFLRYSYPYLSATDFMDFSRTGNRVRFEEAYFAKRRALSALVLAECVEGKGRFMDDVINGIFSICEESAWQLPPHNTYVRDAVQLPLPDETKPVLDLFACETGAVLGCVSYLLKRQLEEVSPVITKRIQNEIKHRITTPYRNTHFWWMGNGKEPMNNWTIWCTQNVLLSVLFTDEDEAQRRAVLEKAVKSVDYFLDEYGEDGCCDEGAQYYRHAGLSLFQTMEILNAVTGGFFSEQYREDKIKNIAAYILNVHVDGKYYINFADCSPVAGSAGAREFLFGERTKNPDLMLFAARDFAEGGTDTLLLPEENNLYYRLQNGFTAGRMLCYAQERTSCALHHPDVWYPSTGLLVARDEHLCMAVKAGDNADSHNHNDAGSFTVYRDGRPLLIDVGVGSYTKQTFSPQRYEIWTMQSAYHNLPLINGVMQKDGKEYRTTDVSCQVGKECCRIDMDLAGAYPAEAGVTSYRRTVTLIKGQGIQIHDRYTGKAPGQGSGPDCGSGTNGPVVLSLMTYGKPDPGSESAGAGPDPGSELCVRIGDLGTIELRGASWLGAEEIPIADPRLAAAWKGSVWRIRLLMTGEETWILLGGEK